MFDILGDAAGLVKTVVGGGIGVAATAIWKGRKIKAVYDESKEFWASIESFQGVIANASDEVRTHWAKTRKEGEDVRTALRNLF
jgi:hypothetical protein